MPELERVHQSVLRYLYSTATARHATARNFFNHEIQLQLNTLALQLEIANYRRKNS